MNFNKKTSHDDLMVLKEDISKALKLDDFENLSKIVLIVGTKKMTLDLLKSTLFGKIMATVCAKLK